MFPRACETGEKLIGKPKGNPEKNQGNRWPPKEKLRPTHFSRTSWGSVPFFGVLPQGNLKFHRNPHKIQETTQGKSSFKNQTLEDSEANLTVEHSEKKKKTLEKSENPRKTPSNKNQHLWTTAFLRLSKVGDREDSNSFNEEEWIRRWQQERYEEQRLP